MTNPFRDQEKFMKACDQTVGTDPQQYAMYLGLIDEESKELDQLATYDQLLNTVGKGVQCDDCGRKEAELYEKYYPKSLES